MNELQIIETLACNIHIKEDYYIKEFYTYEEAELACLIKLIEIEKWNKN
jgi:hypothetical protein